MRSERKTTVILVGIVLVALVICGVLGYINDPRRAPGDPTSDSEFPITLTYCYTDLLSLCIVSFGSDSANNTLIVVKNSNPDLAEFYLKITADDFRERYECQQVQFSAETFYCFGKQINDGAIVTIEVYSKNGNRLIAKGIILASLGATPTPEVTNTVFPLTATTTAAAPTPAFGTNTPSYPNPPYSNPTSYPNPSPYPNP